MIEHLRCVLEGLALEEPGQEEIPLLPEPELVVEIEVVVDGEQAAALELDERGCDQEELGGQLEITGIDPLDLGQIGIDDLEQRDLVQVDLVTQDQVQQQIERALEHVGPHTDR